MHIAPNMDESNLKDHPFVLIGLDNDLSEMIISQLGSSIEGYVGPSKPSQGLDVDWLGLDDDYSVEQSQKSGGRIGVIAVDEANLKKKLAAFHSYLSFPTVTSPLARISNNAVIGHGCIIQAGVMISRNVIIERFVKLNIDAQIHHDCSIGPYSTICPGARILGNTVIGEGVLVGANATVLPNLIIEDYAKIGAGAVITKNVGASCVMAGNPGVKLS